MAANNTKALTTEIGNQNLGIIPWSAYYDTVEEVPELAWPNSPRLYDKMRNDEQIAALLLSFMLPIMGYRWYIDPNGARDEVVQHVANDFGLPIKGEEPLSNGRLKDRFSHEDYLRHALLKIVFGTMFFEQVYRLGDDQLLHLRKLAPRMLGSIWQIQIEPDGGLDYIRQYPSGTGSFMDGNNAIGARGNTDVNSQLISGLQSPKISVDRLVVHVNDKEGGNWLGRSYLRSLYRVWTLKDRLLRVDALKHERNGMGVPIAYAPPGADKKQMDLMAALAQAYKTGDASGGSMPNGSKLELVGVSGTLPDTLATIKYYDEQMARRFLAMFTQLGSTATGSRALGSTFVDFFGLAQQAAAESYVRTTNAHAIEDLVDLNYSIDEAAPRLAFMPESDRGLATADLVGLIQVGALTVDQDLEDYLRAENDLPEKPIAGEDQVDPTEAVEPPASDVNNPVPDKTLKPIKAKRIKAASNKQRKPTATEEAAKVDYQLLQSTFDDALTTLVQQWSSQIKQAQIGQLSSIIASTAATDLASLANLQATPIGTPLLTAAMQNLARQAITQAVAEVTAQGVEIITPTTEALDAALAARAGAVDQLMANSISQAASNAALAQAGGNLSPADVAVNVADHLTGLTDTYLNDQLGGALMTAQNRARMEAFAQVPTKKLYASELSDSPTCCQPCKDIDGHPFDTIEDALEMYPTGGYIDCEGGLRCRGTVVLISANEQDASVQ